MLRKIEAGARPGQKAHSKRVTIICNYNLSQELVVVMNVPSPQHCLSDSRSQQFNTFLTISKGLVSMIILARATACVQSRCQCLTLCVAQSSSCLPPPHPVLFFTSVSVLQMRSLQCCLCPATCSCPVIRTPCPDTTVPVEGAPSSAPSS